MANAWFRLYSEFANDPKIQRMSEAFQRRYIMLLCMRRIDESSPFDDETVAFQLRISEEEASATRNAFINSGLITDGWVLVTDLETSPDRPFAHIWREIRERIFRRDDYTCQYCGKRGVKLECDHVFPVSRGGGHEDENLVTACFVCNRSKRDKTVEEWKRK